MSSGFVWIGYVFIDLATLQRYTSLKQTHKHVINITISCLLFCLWINVFFFTHFQLHDLLHSPGLIHSASVHLHLFYRSCWTVSQKMATEQWKAREFTQVGETMSAPHRKALHPKSSCYKTVPTPAPPPPSLARVIVHWLHHISFSSTLILTSNNPFLPSLLPLPLSLILYSLAPL